MIERPVGSYKDLVNFTVDMEDETVWWQVKITLIEADIEREAQFYEEKMDYSEQQALSLASKKLTSPGLTFDLYEAARIVDNLHHDRITGERYSPPKRVPAHLIVFGDHVRNFTLYISGASGEAILSEYLSDEEVAFVDLRFGRCRTTR